MQLTDEQARAVELACSGKSLKVKALAGAGKTTTLKEVAKQLTHKIGMYISFNRAIAEEAKGKLPPNTKATTAHQLAFKAVGHLYRKRLLQKGSMSGKKLAQELDLPAFENVVAPARLGGLVSYVLEKFCQSSGDSINKELLPTQRIEDIVKDAVLRKINREYGDSPLVNGISRSVLQNRLQKKLTSKLEKAVIGWAEKAWEEVESTNSTMPVTHDMYLKLWALSKPVLDVDFILFDEAQDANPVLLGLLQNQTAQLIVVGDSFQQIYSWRGSMNAMEDFKTDNECQLSQSFRFGPEIAEVANAVLATHLKSDVRVSGSPSVNSEVGPCTPDAVIFRTNSGMLGLLIVLVDQNKKVYVEGGTQQLLAQIYAAKALRSGKPTHHSLFEGCISWDDAVNAAKDDQDLEQIVNLFKKYHPDQLIRALKGAEAKQEGCIVLTTVHKSKGKEWDKVWVMDDFKYPSTSCTGNLPWIPEEANLLYVAVTRAKYGLNIDNCTAALHALKLFKA